MITIHSQTGNFIGAGEKSTITILQRLTNLPLHEKSTKDLIEGIHSQIEISWLLKPEQLQSMSQEFLKGSVDIVITKDERIIAVRVQGRNHGEHLKGLGKARKDRIQKGLLEDNEIEVVDIEFRECVELFKERVSEKSIQEVMDSFKTSCVELPI